MTGKNFNNDITLSEVIFEINSELRDNKIKRITLAKSLGITPSYVTYILNTSRRLTFERLRDIANALGMSLEDLLRKVGERRRGK